MSQPVNLNRFRKDKARAEKKARADQNALKFGQTKSQKKINKINIGKTVQELDGHKIQE